MTKSLCIQIIKSIDGITYLVCTLFDSFSYTEEPPQKQLARVDDQPSVLPEGQCYVEKLLAKRVQFCRRSCQGSICKPRSRYPQETQLL